jgi:hypothetical protein
MNGKKRATNASLALVISVSYGSLVNPPFRTSLYLPKSFRF